MNVLWALVAIGAIVVHAGPGTEAGRLIPALCLDLRQIVHDTHRFTPVECRPIVVEDVYELWEDIRPTANDWALV